MYDNYSFDFLISYCNSICTFLQHERRCRIERTKNTMLKLDFQMHFDVYVRVFRHLVFVYVYIQCCKFGIFCQLWPWGNNAMR
jgi:hypothetical protein